MKFPALSHFEEKVEQKASDLKNQIEGRVSDFEHKAASAEKEAQTFICKHTPEIVGIACCMQKYVAGSLSSEQAKKDLHPSTWEHAFSACKDAKIDQQGTCSMATVSTDVKRVLNDIHVKRILGAVPDAFTILPAPVKAFIDSEVAEDLAKCMTSGSDKLHCGFTSKQFFQSGEACLVKVFKEHVSSAFNPMQFIDKV